MSGNVKVHLSAEEAGLITNGEWILTKQNIIKKVYQLLGNLNELMKQELVAFGHSPVFMSNANGKISRGENYRQLPYVILDFPGYFGKDNIFAIRSMFWWANFFSITLHLSGDHKSRLISNHPAVMEFLKEKNFFVCVNSEEWEHHFEEKNYQTSSSISLVEFDKLITRPFFKAAKKISLEQWEQAEDFLIAAFKEILELLEINSQGGKKGLSPGFPTIDFDL